MQKSRPKTPVKQQKAIILHAVGVQVHLFGEGVRFSTGFDAGSPRNQDSMPAWPLAQLEENENRATAGMLTKP